MQHSFGKDFKPSRPSFGRNCTAGPGFDLNLLEVRLTRHPQTIFKDLPPPPFQITLALSSSPLLDWAGENRIRVTSKIMTKESRACSRFFAAPARLL
jgi:hypothetical protein